MVWLSVLVAAAGCAADLVREGGIYRHRELGYVIAPPPGPEGYWARVTVRDVDLAFRGGRGETISLAADCNRTVGPAKILARHLRIGMPEHRMRSSGEVEVDGQAGWMQILDARTEGATVRLKTVTAVAAGCIYDWVLVAREGFEAVEPSFDAWWSSFRVPSRAASERVP